MVPWWLILEIAIYWSDSFFCLTLGRQPPYKKYNNPKTAMLWEVRTQGEALENQRARASGYQTCEWWCHHGSGFSSLSHLGWSQMNQRITQLSLSWVPDPKNRGKRKYCFKQLNTRAPGNVAINNQIYTSWEDNIDFSLFI